MMRSWGCSSAVYTAKLAGLQGRGQGGVGVRAVSG
jgi:hypothetical protein